MVKQAARLENNSNLRLDEVLAVKVPVTANCLVQVLLLSELGFSFGDLLLEVEYLHLTDLHLLHVLQDLNSFKQQN